VALQKLHSIKETIIELATVAKACLTTFWFWVPPIFAVYMWLQLWLMFFVHPLTLIIVPAILLIYSLVQEDKRIKAMYGMQNAKKKKALDPLGSAPQELTGYKWDVEKALEDYEKTLKSKKEKQKN
jgi:hypothetical protein